MLVQPEVFADPRALGLGSAELVLDGVITARSAGREFLLGCPGGRSAGPTYRALAELTERRQLDLGHVVVVMMDDYLVPGPDGVLQHEDEKALHSCIRFGVEEIVAPWSAAAGPGRGITDDHFWMPDPAEPAAYDRAIEAAGGIDVFLLASGAGDGHVAFNAPGSGPDTQTRIVDLPDSTRRDNLATFPSFGGDLGRVPRHGVTVGIDTIRRQSRSVLMLAHGADKGPAVRRLQAASGYDPSWPATVFAACNRSQLLIDRAAADAARSPSAPRSP